MTPNLLSTSSGPVTTAPEPAAEPRLLSTDQMAEFVSRGLLRFDGLIDAKTNEVALAELRAASGPSPLPGLSASRYTPGVSLGSCFTSSAGIGAMLRSPAVDGIIKSLVGADPIYDHHAVHVRAAGVPSQPLHGDAIIDTRAAFDIQLMYYPQDVTAAGGGTLLVPGSQFRQINEQDIARYQNLAGQVCLECPAGTVLVLHHGLWHCGRRNRTDDVRYMFKVRLNPRREQVRLWDTADIDDPVVKDRVRKTLSTKEPWYEGATARIEQVQRAALYRRLSGDPTFEVEYWLGRLGHQPDPRLRDLLP
jgi:ribosomal protein S27AE